MVDQTHLATPTNPLARHFRQPALYLKLPSNGAHWPEGSIDLPLNNEIAVLPMSTKDEITLKTPDALLNGQGVVNVIESCCPSIKNAWLMPSIDVDAAIIAIRIASYGNEMDFGATCPSCKEKSEYAIDLTVVLGNINAPVYTQKIAVDDLKIKIKPQAYFNVNKSNTIAFEEQQILKSLSQLNNDPEEVKKIFDQQLTKIIDLNVALLTGSTAYIELSDGTIVSDEKYITEFYNNCNSSVIKKVRAKLIELSAEAGITPIPVNCHSCEHEFNVAIEFDFASFFAVGS
jgi:hypothetical protein